MRCQKVLCKCCGHDFIWLGESDRYVLNDAGQKGYVVVCPKCLEKLAVFEDELEADSVFGFGKILKNE